MYKRFLKRGFDLASSLIGVVILSPFFLMTFILLAAANSGTPFFVQSRAGLNGHLFRIIKFKTMNDNKDKHGNLLPDCDRLTKIGSFVRKTSLDELPQLFNVIKGDMSIIGPRPLLLEYLPLYNKSEFRRHSVKPGITGWAQVNGRNTISWEEKFTYDVEYVDTLSFFLDLKILFITFKKVIKREGISSGQSVTMEAFKGFKVRTNIN